MPRPSEIQSIIEEVVAEVLDTVLPNLRAEIARRATEELEMLNPAHGSSPTDLLSGAVSAIQEGNSQSEILRHLLEGAARFAGRVALFVVKGGAMTCWQGMGFVDNDAIKNVSMDLSGGLAGQAVQGRMIAAGPVAEFDSDFAEKVRTPAQNNCVVVPLVVKDKVAAVIYADGGLTSSGATDAAAITALSRFAAIWLELTAMRKSGAGMAAPVDEVPSAYAASAPTSSVPAQGAPAQSSAHVAFASESSAGGFSSAGEDSDLHKKAKRFAKLLVEEIKLYNQPKVAEGKQNRDLYDRLREDIEKSRATYEKRYSDTEVAAAGYFNQELIRILADSDVSLMGLSFPH
jgi:putative methionine-R-sulfoxide reductase with GAF domain